MSRVLIALVVPLVISATAKAQQDPSQENLGARPVGILAESGQRVDRFLSSLEPYGFSGAVIVALGDEVLLNKGYGLADRARQLPMQPTSVSTMGSITKQFTAAGILKLADQGKLDVQDPITGYFENVPEDKRGITLHHLLTHTSGLSEVMEFGDKDQVSASQFIELAMAMPLNAPPGEQFDYTNTGYSLLGIIIEQLTGDSYETWLRNNILIPAGLKRTGYQKADWEGLTTAQGYSNGAHWGVVLEQGWLEDGPGWILRANGGLHTVTEDMLAWRHVLRGSEVLSEQSRSAWIAPHVDEGGGDSFYGYGWEIHPDTPIGKMVAHNGGNGVFSADFVWFEQPDLFIYITGNQNVLPAADLREFLIEALFNPDVQAAPSISRWEGAQPEHAQALAGSYANGDLVLQADHLNLLARIKGQRAINLSMGYDADTRQRYAMLSARAKAAIHGLVGKDSAAFEGFIEDKKHAAARADSLINWINNFESMAGPLQGLDLYGTVTANPGRSVEGATAVSYLAARFDGGIMVLGMNWNPANEYLGTTIGPPSDLPSLILIPQDESHWRAWPKASAHLGGVLEAVIEEGRRCWLGTEQKFCRDPEQ